MAQDTRECSNRFTLVSNAYVLYRHFAGSFRRGNSFFLFCFSTFDRFALSNICFGNNACGREYSNSEKFADSFMNSQKETWKRISRADLMYIGIVSIFTHIGPTYKLRKLFVFLETHSPENCILSGIPVFAVSELNTKDRFRDFYPLFRSQIIH